MPTQTMLQNVLPEASGDVYWTNLQDPGSGGKWDHGIWVFTDSGEKDALHGSFLIPSDYSSGAQVDIYWTANAATGSIVWDFDYRVIPFDDTASIDQATAQESDTVTDGAPSIAFEGLIASLTGLTAGNFVAGRICQFILFRDGVNASDDLAASGLLVDLIFSYTA